MPENFLYVVLAVAALVVVAMVFSWLLAHLLLIALIAVAVGVAIYFIRRRNIRRYSR